MLDEAQKPKIPERSYFITMNQQATLNSRGNFSEARNVKSYGISPCSIENETL
jgi:hypothetical protein